MEKETKDKIIFYGICLGIGVAGWVEREIVTPILNEEAKKLYKIKEV